MKKFAKMSLVAAVAVAGLTNVNAASLEEAIKGVDISGQVRYRFEEISNGAEDQDVNIDVKVKVPVTDNVSFIANANFDDDTQEGGATASDSSGTLDQYYFQYVNGAATVNAGTQTIPGRLTDAEQGSGLVGLYNAGAFTVGAVAMYNTDVGSEAFYSAIAMGNIGPVSLLAQYADMADTMNSYNVKADAKIGPAMIGVEYANTDWDADNLDYETLKAYVSGAFGPLSAKLSYAKTDDGAGSIDTAAETASEFLLWQLGSASQARFETEFNVWALDASYAVTDKISLRAAYADGEFGTADTDVSEILGQVSYKVSSNLNTYLRVSELDVDNEEDVTRGRIEVKYSF